MADDVAYIAQMLAAPSHTMLLESRNRSNARREDHSDARAPRTAAPRRAEPPRPPSSHASRKTAPKPTAPGSKTPPSHSQRRKLTAPPQAAAESGAQGSSSARSSSAASPASFRLLLGPAGRRLPGGCSKGPGCLRCDWCGCRVGRCDDDWRTHAAGIQHRRQALSMLLFAEPGHLVVSQFEAMQGAYAQSVHASPVCNPASKPNISSYDRLSLQVHVEYDDPSCGPIQSEMKPYTKPTKIHVSD